MNCRLPKNILNAIELVGSNCDQGRVLIATASLEPREKIQIPTDKFTFNLTVFVLVLDKIDRGKFLCLVSSHVTA